LLDVQEVHWFSSKDLRSRLVEIDTLDMLRLLKGESVHFPIADDFEGYVTFTLKEPTAHNAEIMATAWLEEITRLRVVSKAHHG